MSDPNSNPSPTTSPDGTARDKVPLTAAGVVAPFARFASIAGYYGSLTRISFMLIV